jgi:TetR/AcrR family transcriptional repressor of nem operon
VAQSTKQVDTRPAILDVAERLVQRRGFNGFSYADVADELGITRAALHYHFPGKFELGEALIARYAARFTDALTAIDSQGCAASSKLRAYADLYLEVLRDERMCLCGMLAAEHETLSEPMRQIIVGFLDDNHAWLVGVLETGRREGSLTFSGPPEDLAPMVVGTLEGAMLVARPYGGTARFESVAARLIADLSTASPASR